MKMRIDDPGLLTTVQDTGRKGYQKLGIPIAGAMDHIALRMGNIMVGNEEDAAALEITLLGPSISVISGKGLVCAAGADPGMLINGIPSPSWTCMPLKEGDRISFKKKRGKRGCRCNLCISGGIDVPVFLGSRSTYLRGKLGGFEGRAIARGDILETGYPHSLWRRMSGFQLPEELLPDYDMQRKLRAVPGPQEDYFSKEAVDLFFSTEWNIGNSSDRMGYRLEGNRIEHLESADIVSDAIPPGSIQIPGDGQPIVMLADSQTTGGYTKIAVLCSEDRAYLAQRMPGDTVSFQKISQVSAIANAAAIEDRLSLLKRSRAAWTSSFNSDQANKPVSFSGHFKLRIDGEEHSIDWEIEKTQNGGISNAEN